MTDPDRGSAVPGSQDQPQQNQRAKSVADGDIRYRLDRTQITTLACRGREFVRRIFVTVRDHQWRETPPTRWEEKPLDVGHGFALRALHRSSSVEFEWEGVFRIERNIFTFSMEGRALRDTDICRVGLVVLYPIRPLIGALLRTEGPDGQQYFRIEREISPQRVIDAVPQGMTPPFSSLSFEELQGGSALSCRFNGELFEFEDQRNWGDASFKAYCTPLRSGFPRLMKNGTVIRQEVQMTLAPCSALAANRSDSVFEARIADQKDAFRFPELGSAGLPETASKESGPAWSYVRLDVADLRSYSRATRDIEQIQAGTKVELCASLSDDDSSDGAFLALLQRFGSSIRRVLVRGLGVGLSSEKNVARLRKVLHDAGAPLPQFLVSTAGHFVELNRDNPPLRLDGVAFPFCSTVHLADHRTVSESPSVVADMVLSARKLSGQDEITISPLALFYPSRGVADAIPREIAIPWALAVLIEAAKAQVTSVTLAVDLLAALSASGLPHLFNLLGSWSGEELRPVNIACEDIYVAIMASKNHEWQQVIFVNLSESPIEIRWYRDGIRIRRVMNALTGDFIDMTDNEPVEVPAETALIASVS